MHCHNTPNRFPCNFVAKMAQIPVYIGSKNQVLSPLKKVRGKEIIQENAHLMTGFVVRIMLIMHKIISKNRAHD